MKFYKKFPVIKSINLIPLAGAPTWRGANFAALITVFGEEAVSRIKSCEFHFKDQRNKKAQRLDNENSGRFKELCNLLLTSETEDGYAKSKAAMDAFIEVRITPSQKHGYLSDTTDVGSFVELSPQKMPPK